MMPSAPSSPLLRIAGLAVPPVEALLAMTLACAVLLLLVALLLVRSRRHQAREAMVATQRALEMEEQVAAMTRLQAEMTGRMQTMAEVFGSRQVDVARMLAERIDTGSHRQAETLARLHERLGLIDAAQKNLSALTGEVVGLKDILANKQARGAWGQGRMEAILRDALPPDAYAFQATLSNRTRPDCLLRLPGDPRGLVIDAKFPLESFTAFREARGPEGRARAAARARADVMTHVKDIDGKYFIPGETQDMALMFVPSESIYADLQEHFEDVVQRAQRARVLIVSPALLALAVQLVQTLSRDARIREEARVIQTEVGRLVEEVGRLAEKAAKLDTHFRQAQEDVAQVRGAAERIARRGRRIESLDFAEPSLPLRAAE